MGCPCSGRTDAAARLGTAGAGRGGRRAASWAEARHRVWTGAGHRGGHSAALRPVPQPGGLAPGPGCRCGPGGIAGHGGPPAFGALDGRGRPGRRAAQAQNNAPYCTPWPGAGGAWMRARAIRRTARRRRRCAGHLHTVHPARDAAGRLPTGCCAALPPRPDRVAAPAAISAAPSCPPPTAAPAAPVGPLPLRIAAPLGRHLARHRGVCHGRAAGGKHERSIRCGHARGRERGGDLAGRGDTARPIDGAGSGRAGRPEPPAPLPARPGRAKAERLGRAGADHSCIPCKGRAHRAGTGTVPSPTEMSCSIPTLAPDRSPPPGPASPPRSPRRAGTNNRPHLLSYRRQLPSHGPCACQAQILSLCSAAHGRQDEGHPGCDKGSPHSELRDLRSSADRGDAARQPDRHIAARRVHQYPLKVRVRMLRPR